MEITAQLVKELREKTGLGMMDCKKALTETQGNLEEAVDYLRKKGALKAAKREGRATSEGRIGSYIHMTGKIGVLLELNCESDFVAKTEEFNQLAKDLCMQVAASAPRWVNPEDIPADIVAKEKDIYMGQAKEAGKPEKMLEKIAEGKLKKFYSEVCLMEQNFVKEPDKTVTDLIKEKIAQLGENITVGRFVRFQLGETSQA
ncbi:MAG TPA: translation elongation factor Ts [Desulfomonilaceae bacterium]|nr:translation elongation factor Ts [Desulfomonilaceae bacterium]